MSKENHTECRPNFRYWIVITAFGAGMAAGYFMKSCHPTAVEAYNDKEVRQAGYQFINPLLECEKGEGSVNVLIRSFKSGLLSLINTHRKSGNITDTAVYFRDLNNGPWYGVNENDKFRPASLLKIPIAMAFYKAAEDDPGVLKQRFKHTTGVLPLQDKRTQNIISDKRLEPGKEYTVEELIAAMIRYSDNHALSMLFGVIPGRYLWDLYKALGVENDVLEKADGTLSIRAFSTFYRILFNASYLNRQYSEKLLRLLSESEYKNALVAGIPDEIAVAHKFGESGLRNKEHQLQDCGIVYFPKRPYLLCVMAKGRKLRDLENYIKDLSRFVYDQVRKSGNPET